MQGSPSSGNRYGKVVGGLFIVAAGLYMASETDWEAFGDSKDPDYDAHLTMGSMAIGALVTGVILAVW